MRRLAFLVATGLILTGCESYVGSPLVGFGGFVGNTHLFRSNPNMPAGTAENLMRAQGQQVAAEPLVPEAGNIWPGPPPAEPTLEDVIQQEQPDQGGGGGSGAAGSGGAPAVPYGSSAHPQPKPATGPGSGAAPSGSGPAPPASNGGVTTKNTPGEGTSIVVPNGNGTSTIIGPDGSTRTVPTPN